MEENKFITLLSKHWSKLLTGVLLLVVGLVWGQKLWNANHSDKKQDFFIANQIFDRFEKGEYLPAESIEATQKILERHPELHPKYDLVLALTFFSQQKVNEAVPYARSLIEHAEAEMPSLYKEFADATLLISEEKYSEALSSALKLEQKLNSESAYPILAGMNTLRIYFLADQLGLAEPKRVAWEKLEKHPSFPALTALFHEGEISLKDLKQH